MTAILIRNLEPSLIETLKVEAEKLQWSVNRLVKTLLEQAVSKKTTSSVNQAKNDLAKFAGGWTASDAKEFKAATAMFDQIDEDMWK
jgi:plasmid stability protein